MFFASHTRADIDHYNEFFNKQIPMPVYDAQGNEVGTWKFFKYSISNKAIKDIKVASEDSGAKAFRQLYEKDRDFYNFVTDPNRLRARFEQGIHGPGFGYANARKAMNRMTDSSYTPTDSDLNEVYKIFNHVIPSDGGGDARHARDVFIQRSKFFDQLKKAGYDAVLDTNDALYNSVKAQSPVIVFNMESVIPEDVYRTTMKDVYKAKALTFGRRVLGLA